MTNKELTIVTDKMNEAGSKIASDLMDAHVAKSMGGLGGSKSWADYTNAYVGENLDLIERYVNHEIDSVTAIYIAMHRAMSLCNPQTVASEVHDESVYKCLCWKDSRHPMYVCRYLDEEEQIPRINCSCDNCFYGRDRLAVEILRLRG